MNDAFSTAFARYLASLERLVDDPQPPFGYGRDISCVRDLDPGVEVEGVTALAQALARRLDTPRGGLVDDPDFGFDLRSQLNKGSTQAEMNSLAARIRNELTKDDRVSMVSVTVAPLDTRGSSVRVTVRVRPKNSSEPFSMTLAVTSAEIVMEAMAA
jgi:phage baseplate assembly protein W